MSLVLEFLALVAGWYSVFLQQRTFQRSMRQALPVLAVAAYSALLLASLRAFGAECGQAYAGLPKWRRNARRPSCFDLITLLRKEMTQQPQLLAPFDFQITQSCLVHAAAARKYRTPSMHTGFDTP